MAIHNAPCVDGALQRLIVPPAKRFTESILWNYQEESLPQIILDAYKYSNDASKTRTEILISDIQIGRSIQKVLPYPDIP